MRALALALLLAQPAGAQQQIDGDTFEALVEGRSLGWVPMGGSEPYGIELYHPKRRVVWFRVGTDECVEGRWEEVGPENDPAICFQYEDRPERACWETWHDGKDRLGAINLATGAMIGVDLGGEHDLSFGCEFVGM